MTKQTKGKVSTKAVDPAKTYQSIKDLTVLIDNDAEKFFVNESAAAGRRIRGNANQIAKLCKQLRKEIQELVNARKEVRGQ